MTDAELLKSRVTELRLGISSPTGFCLWHHSDKCEDCPCHTGKMDGECCRGLMVAASRQLASFHRGGCNKKALQKRFDTLANYLETVIERLNDVT